jgi:carbon dioxide concentrating mechanism protein CcmM
MSSQVRSLLAQGYRIGIEHASERRFKTSSWKTGAPIQATSPQQAVSELQACLGEYQGEYVRLIGIDPKAKRRVVEVIIQRPNEKAPRANNSVGNATVNRSSNGGVSAGLTEDISSQVKSLLAQGYRLGVEYASERRFKTSSWQTSPGIETTSPQQAIAQLQDCMAEHPGEYVRLIGIDPQAKRRVLETLIQRPNGPVKVSSSSTTQTPSYTSSSSNGSSSSITLSSETIQQVRSLLGQGYRIGTEHTDKRRFKIGSWKSCSPIESQRDTEVLAALEACIKEHKGEYVRLLGIDRKQKRRVAETIIQRPTAGVR